MHQSKRFQARAGRDINKDSYIREWPETGLILFHSPCDPLPQIRVHAGRVVELDGTPEAQFDILDRFIARRAIDPAVAEAAMAMDSREIARMLVDITTPRAEIVRLFSGLTPAKIMQVVDCLNVVEMMMALQKMRARRTPSNQAHVTNKKENPALLAADAAEAVERGFAELETTVGVARYAPFNAMAVLVGSQTGRGTALTQCAVEESLGLRLALLGLTTYAETLSVYGTAQAFHDGDDSPWSKAFLASAYASRGIKVRFTSGTGSEALMGHSEGKSMIYLEARCLMAIKGAGSQGVQNGSISCIALPESLPGGVRGVLAENLIAELLDLELASGNDAMASHSQIRKAAKLMLQFLPGTDFIFSGYSSMPREDNLFGGGNFDAEDLDDYNVLQRDMLADGGLRPVREAEVLAVRRRAAGAIQAVFDELGLPPIGTEEVEAAVAARSSADMPDRDVVADLEAAERFLREGRDGVDVIRALARRGFADIAEKILAIQRLRVSGDYLQTSSVVLPGPRVLSAVNDPNEYRGPGTGYQLSAERLREIADLPQAPDPRTIGQAGAAGESLHLEETGAAAPGTDRREIVVAVGPAFGSALDSTLLGLPHRQVLQALVEGIEREQMKARVIKIYATSDCGFIGHAGACLSGSGISIGIQSKGTTVIHRQDLEPLNNLELFPQAPNLTLESYRVIGRNAAKYAKGEPVLPVPIQIDNMARLKYIVKTTILHLRETEQVRPDKPAQELRYA
ncbi:MAG TPA: propanediol/glycerol family dehydratase large subunit [Bryobacteraceae bacterium]|nr:propanediol/glycerol family dehydratase large subunit [Bryobacteraceae bacterium]